MTFPTLYKKTATGAIQQWSIHLECTAEGFGVMVTRHGQVGGTIQETCDTIKEGKNLGKANETTAIRQGELECKAKWDKQKKKGYVESLEDAQNGQVDETVIEGGIAPMLAPSKIYPTFAKKLKWPVLVQPKLDGSRLIAVLKDGKCTLWSRTRKRVNSLPHIAKAVEEQLGKFGDAIYDGEAWNKEVALEEGFEGLMSLIRQQEPTPGHEAVEYWVYDVPSIDKPQAQRDADRGALLAEVTGPIKIVQTQICHSHEAVMKAHERNLEFGFEGSMVRSNNGMYEQGRRSYGLQKLKNFVDDDFPIIGAEEGRGKDKGTVGSFICKTPGGKEFRCRLKATYERRRELFQNTNQWMGMKMTIMYQNLTLDGVPRFPIGKGLRKTTE